MAWPRERRRHSIAARKGARTKRKITYHGRTGRPVLHRDKSGRKYVMVRAKGGGVKRLYEGSKYAENGRVKRLRL